VISPLAKDPELWLIMVNDKPPYLLYLEIESMNKFILEFLKVTQTIDIGKFSLIWDN